MVSERLHGVPGRAGLGDENLPKGLRRALHHEHASQDAQDGSRQTGSSQPRVSAGHEGCGEASSSTRGTPEGEASAGRWWPPGRAEVPGEFGAGHASEQRMEYKDSIPIERRPTLLVAEVLAAERAPGVGWSRPAMADRGRGIGDLGMAGLNIGAPARLQRGGRALLSAGASTPLH